MERGTVRVTCLAQEHNTMSPARAQTRTARSVVERTNHEANPRLRQQWYVIDTFYIPHWRVCNHKSFTRILIKHLARVRLFSCANLKMMNESSKSDAKLLSQIFILNCLSKVSLIRIVIGMEQIKSSQFLQVRLMKKLQKSISLPVAIRLTFSKTTVLAKIEILEQNHEISFTNVNLSWN